MFLGRVAAIAFAVVAATLAAQQTQLVHLPIKVTDVTGAVIPGAQIQIDRSSGETKIAVTTDNNGETAVDLSPENHVVSITAPGFASLNKKIELKDGSGQTFVAVLEVGGGGPCAPNVCVEQPTEIPIEFEHYPVDADIPLIPLQELALSAKLLRPRHASNRRNHT